MKKVIIGSACILSAILIMNVIPAAAKSGTPTPAPKASTVKAKAKIVAVPKAKAVTTTKAVATSTKAVTAKAPVKKAAPAKAVTAKASTTLVWDASAKKIINNYASFDYSSVIRNAYIKKVEAYARRNNIKVITAAVVNGMHE
jgi:hypothetical protein